jgi:hypothetical protein
MWVLGKGGDDVADTRSLYIHTSVYPFVSTVHNFGYRIVLIVDAFWNSEMHGPSNYIRIDIQNYPIRPHIDQISTQDGPEQPQDTPF